MNFVCAHMGVKFTLPKVWCNVDVVISFTVAFCRPAVKIPASLLEYELMF